MIVETRAPKELDDIVQSLGPAAVVDGSWDGTTARVRVFGNPGFIKFALDSQGYAKVIGEEPIP